MFGSGRFISLEGGEGIGKSTQLKLLAARLRERGIDVDETREPGGTEGAERIRELLVTGAADRWSGASEALLVNAARSDHVERRIRPALSAGRWVVCDRFVDSTLAYQGAGKGLPDSDLETLHIFATAGLWPNLTLVLDAPPEVTLKRARKRGGGRFELHDAAFHERVRAEYLELTARWPERCRLIDAQGTVEATAALIWEQVEQCFARQLSPSR